MMRRPRRSLPAALVAAVLLAIAVLFAVAVVQSLLGQVPFVNLDRLLALGSTQRWDSAGTIGVAIVIALLGLILLVAALRPGAPTVLPLGRATDSDGRPAAEAGVRRRSLATDLAATAAAVPGVTDASVTAGRNRITARVRVAATDPAAIPDQVRGQLETRIAAIGPATRPRVRVRARPDKHL